MCVNLIWCLESGIIVLHFILLLLLFLHLFSALVGYQHWVRLWNVHKKKHR